MTWKFASYYLVSNIRIVVFVIQGVYFANLNVNESFIYYLIGRIISRFKGFREWNSGYLGTFHTCCKLQWVHVLLFWEKCSEKHRCIKETLNTNQKDFCLYSLTRGAISLSSRRFAHQMFMPYSFKYFKAF